MNYYCDKVMRFSFSKNMKIGVACVLLDTNKCVWLSQRLGPYQTGKYACPGGMVEPTDNSDVDAIQREVAEETGINIVDTSWFERSITSYHLGGKSDITQWFVLNLTEYEKPVNMEPTKHGEWRKYTLKEAKELSLMMSTSEVLNTL